MRVWAGVLLALGLTACSQGSEQAAESSEAAVEMAVPPPPPPPDAAAAPASTEAASAGSPPPATQGRTTPPPPPVGANAPPQSAAPMLAYSYQYAVEAPAAGVIALLRQHEEACLAAGPLTCQLVGSSTEQAGERELSAQLTFRATPTYVLRFRNGLARGVSRVEGEIASSKIETEDLSRSIIDTEARLRAGRLLRSRLEQLIASRPGDLEQLLAIERELARVGGEIDAAESTLAVMRARVAMSTVTITYASEGAVIDPGDSRPLAEAGDSFARNLASSSAAILTFLSLMLPWAVVLGLIGWGVSALARRNKRRNMAKPRPLTSPKLT